MPHPSIWLATAAESSFPALHGDLAADVAIVGGGITGITAALLLADAGKSVVVLEARRVGGGTTGHSTGNLYALAGDGLAAIEKRWDAETMRLVAASRAMAVDRVERIVQALRIDCQFGRRPFHLISVDGSSDSAERLERERDACVRAGLAARVEPFSPLPFAAGPALVVENQAQFHPLAYVRGLAACIASERLRIFEHTHVEEVDADKGGVRTDRGSITAAAIVMASHTPKGFNVVQTELGPYREHAVAAELHAGHFPTGIYWTLESERHSLRHFAHEGRQFVMVVGERHKTGQAPEDEDGFANLERYLRDTVGVGPASFRWSAQGYVSADGLPYIGRSAASDGLYVATGFATDGLTYGTLAAHLLCDEILERSNDYAEVYKATRMEVAKAAKNFVKENANTVGEYVKDYAKLLRAEKLQDVARGEGRIVEVEGRRCGVHRTETGELVAVSPICTHLKCVVHWNRAEQTWDCPCHGSRFNPDGSVIEGPALHALERIPIEGAEERRAA